MQQRQSNSRYSNQYAAATQPKNKQTTSRDLTMHEAEHFVHMLFKKLGFVVLEQAYGNVKKVDAYLDLIDQCEDELIRLRDRPETSSDRKYDMGVLLNNLSILRKHAQCDFKPERLPDGQGSCNLNNQQPARATQSHPIARGISNLNMGSDEDEDGQFKVDYDDGSGEEDLGNAEEEMFTRTSYGTLNPNVNRRREYY